MRNRFFGTLLACLALAFPALAAPDRQDISTLPPDDIKVQQRRLTDTNGGITLSALEFYVVERVKHLTDGAQSPVLLNPKGVPDYPMAVLR